MRGLGRRTGFRVWGVAQVLALGSAALRLWGCAVGWWPCLSSLLGLCHVLCSVDVPGAVLVLCRVLCDVDAPGAV